EVNGQRFFDKYILPSLQRLDDETGMTVMASDDGYSIDGWVGEHGTSIGGGFGKTRLLAVYHAVDTASGGNGMELRTGCFEGWDQHARGIVARTDKTHHRPLCIEGRSRR